MGNSTLKRTASRARREQLLEVLSEDDKLERREKLYFGREEQFPQVSLTWAGIGATATTGAHMSPATKG